MYIYKNKYLKYKLKYLKLKKNQKGGIVLCDRVYKNVHETCWAIGMQMIFTFGQATSKDLETLMNSFRIDCQYTNIIKSKKCFIEEQIQKVINNPQLYNFFAEYIFEEDNINFVKTILDKFIDRYYSKIFDIKNPEKPVELDNVENPERCELVISQSFYNLFGSNIFLSKNISYHNGNILSHYIFINLLSIFFLGYKVSFTNYYNNFNEIDFNHQNDIGILVLTIKHVCCLFVCNGVLKYYNDWDKKSYDCDWISLLKNTCINNLYIEKGSCLKSIDIKSYKGDKSKLFKVFSLQVISKRTKDNILDTEINNVLNLIKLNETTDIELQLILGNMYNDGEGIAQNDEQTVYYYQLAADQGNDMGQYNLGRMYYNGQGVDKNYEQAALYYKLAADQGYYKAQYKLGNMYYYGQGVDNDYKQAVLYYQLAADQNHDIAQYKLGNMYYNGKGVSKDYCQTVRYYQLAADQGYDEALTKLGNMYYNGEGVVQNHEQAVYYYKLAADQDYDEAQYKLGNMYYNGEGVVQNHEQAAHYYKLAADQGYGKALSKLGNMFYNGEGVV